MAVKQNVACQLCGSDVNLLQCESCKTRLTRGFQSAVCQDCKNDARRFDAFAKLKPSSSTAPAQIHCNLCVAFERQRDEDQLLQAVGGPSQTDMLKSIAFAQPWFLVLSRATAEEKLVAHRKLKRRLDFTTTEQELFAALENDSPHAAMTAFVVQQVAASGNNPAATRLVDSFVHAKVPSIKYKDLLFPPTGSLDKARRHFFRNDTLQ